MSKRHQVNVASVNNNLSAIVLEPLDTNKKKLSTKIPEDSISPKMTTRMGHHQTLVQNSFESLPSVKYNKEKFQEVDAQVDQGKLFKLKKRKNLPPLNDDNFNTICSNQYEIGAKMKVPSMVNANYSNNTNNNMVQQELLQQDGSLNNCPQNNIQSEEFKIQNFKGSQNNHHKFSLESLPQINMSRSPINILRQPQYKGNSNSFVEEKSKVQEDNEWNRDFNKKKLKGIIKHHQPQAGGQGGSLPAAVRQSGVNMSMQEIRGTQAGVDGAKVLFPKI